MNKFKKDIFIPITKIDEDERMVYGWASTPEIDSDGEIIKTEALEKALPAYMKFPTIREMHQPKVAGTTKQADVSKKGMYIGAKIIADEAWNFVKEGLYSGFSVAGNVIKRSGNVIKEMELVEISLVDVPANKASVIEVWKRGKLSKDAESAYSMANLMIQVSDAIYYYEYLGKDTKKLKKALEILKQVVVMEASEDESEKGAFSGESEKVLDMKIKALESFDFEGNQLADSLRKGVIIAMKTKLKKADEITPDEKPEGEKPEGDESDEEETPEAAETTEVVETTETPEGEGETKETGQVASVLSKVAEVEKKLEKLTPTPKTEKVSEDIAKALGSVAGTLAKVADAMVSMEGRVANLEAQPAAPKSRAAIVHKSGDGEEKPPTDENQSAELKAKKSRLVELDVLYEKLGKNSFAKQGFSIEAGNLQKEIQRLEAKA